MTLSHRYQNFGMPLAQNGNAAPTSVEKIEEDKLQSFEDGYQSGWDDAVAAQGTTRDNVTAEFARSLQEASFSYHEARSSIVREFRGIMEPLLDELLPRLSRETVAAHVLEQIESLSKEALDHSIEICTAPNRVVTMQSLFENAIKDPFIIKADDSLKDDQVFIRLGNQEREIDFEPWIQQVQGAVTAYFDSIGEA